MHFPSFLKGFQLIMKQKNNFLLEGESPTLKLHKIKTDKDSFFSSNLCTFQRFVFKEVLENNKNENLLFSLMNNDQ